MTQGDPALIFFQKLVLEVSCVVVPLTSFIKTGEGEGQNR
jgi:hypothetical protein